MNNLAHTLENNEWDEMLNGQIVAMSPRPTHNHNIVSDNITFIFRSFLKGKSCRAYGDGMDVILTDKDRFVPDVMIVCDHNMIQHDGIHGAPDLVVEVLSPSTNKKDRGYKKDCYATAGVKEYWLVDPNNQTVEVYLLENSDLTLRESYALYPDYVLSKMTKEEIDRLSTEFCTAVIPDLRVDLKDIFDGIL